VCEVGFILHGFLVLLSWVCAEWVCSLYVRCISEPVICVWVSFWCCVCDVICIVISLCVYFRINLLWAC